MCKLLLKMAEIKSEELYKKFQCILNELTPQNFLSSTEQALKLDITTVESLRDCVYQIFSKVKGGGGQKWVEFHFIFISQAIEEPNSSITYANLCRAMSPTSVKVEGKHKSTNFRRMLITTCQREFEALLTMLQSINEANTVRTSHDSHVTI